MVMDRNKYIKKTYFISPPEFAFHLEPSVVNECAEAGSEEQSGVHRRQAESPRRIGSDVGQIRRRHRQHVAATAANELGDVERPERKITNDSDSC